MYTTCESACKNNNKKKEIKSNNVAQRTRLDKNKRSWHRINMTSILIKTSLSLF